MSCLEHSQSSGKNRYGFFHLGGKTVYMHRVIYCAHHDILLDDIAGKVIRHTCDNKRCINPEHLILGTQKDNIGDAVERGLMRPRRGESNSNAKLTDSMVKWAKQWYRPNSRQFGVRALARQLGVSHSTLGRAIRGERWKHLEN